MPDVALPDNLLPGQQKKRIWELDFLRGVCILLMVMDHTFFDIAYMFGKHWTLYGSEAAADMVAFCSWYWDHPARSVIHDLVLWIFFVLCGMSVMFSRNNYLHVLKIGMAAALVTLGSLAAEQWGIASGITVRWGVLHMLAATSLICAVLYTLLGKKNKWHPYLFCGLALVVYLVNVLYILRHEWPEDPAWLFIFSDAMGNPGLFTPGDGFPILGSMEEMGELSPWWRVPYLSRVLFGAGVAPLWYATKQSVLPRLDRAWKKPICFIGRHTLVVVIAHQVLIPLLLALITGWFVTPGNYGLF